MLGSPPVTKFIPPRLPTTLVDRAPLLDRMESAGAPVTLVTGFPGAGKTVFLTSWLDAHPERAAAWVSCDSWDHDAERFWTSVVTALRHVSADAGAEALDWVGSETGTTHDFVASLVNDLQTLVEPAALVIDDLHLVPPAATRGLLEFLERLPENMRVVIGSRSEPVLPLHRWRVRGRLAEFRDTDLRLQVHEAGAMLSAFGVELGPGDVEILTRRTEGWAAGVQLVALSLRGRDDGAEFVHRFAGNDRNVADFLVGEVLERQQPETVDFLMATAIVEYFDADLCNWRQLRDMKGSAVVEEMVPESLNFYGRLCGGTLARAHARSGDPIAIAAYLGKKDQFDQSITDFAERYADQNDRDYRAFTDAINSGRLPVLEGV